MNSKIGVYAGKTEVDLSTHIYYAIEIKLCLPYSGKFSKEKIFTNFAILQSPAKVFSTNFKHLKKFLIGDKLVWGGRAGGRERDCVLGVTK